LYKILSTFLFILATAFVCGASGTESFGKAAGILPIAKKEGTLYVLLAERQKGSSSEEGWANFGGLGEEGEAEPKTASRETFEESLGILDIPVDQLSTEKSVQVGPFKSWGGKNVLYRTFFIELKHAIASNHFLEKLESATDHSQEELVNFAWIKLQDIFDHLGDDRFNAATIEGKTINLKLLDNFKETLAKAQSQGIFKEDFQKITPSHSSARKIHRLSEVARYIERGPQLAGKTIEVFFDIDNVLLSSDGKIIEPTVAGQKGTVETIGHLQSKGIKVYALTKRPYSDGFSEKLGALGIHFSEITTLSSENFLPGQGISKGILFSNHKNKGELLSKFLKSAKSASRPFVCFVDDLETNLRDVKGALDGLDIDGEMFHYSLPNSPFAKNNPGLAEKQHHQLAHAVVSKANMNREFKEINEKAQSNVSPKTPYTQTEGHMKLVLGEAYVEGDLKGNVEKMLKKAEETNQGAGLSSAKNIENFVAMIKEEEKHPDRLVAYHAGGKNMMFLYDVYHATPHLKLRGRMAQGIEGRQA